MSNHARTSWPLLVAAAGLALGLCAQEPQQQVTISGQTYGTYPMTLDRLPAIPSPVRAADGTELVIASTRHGKYALVPVTVPDWNREQVRCFESSILSVDGEDFPTLARTGLHAEAELDCARTITGRPIAEITEMSRPGRLSTAGFMAEDEDIVSVLKGDDRMVRALGLTHPQLARPLLHLLNLITEEQKKAVGTWNGLAHAWVNFDHVLYNGERIFYRAEFSKGGQKSPFNDGIEGGVHVELWRAMEPQEEAFLEGSYSHLPTERLAALKEALSRMHTGEMEPFYIVRYGFYEGHTFWRTDPIAIAFVFGIRSLEEIEAAFPGRLDEVLSERFVSKPTTHPPR